MDIPLPSDSPVGGNITLALSVDPPQSSPTRDENGHVDEKFVELNLVSPAPSVTSQQSLSPSHSLSPKNPSHSPSPPPPQSCSPPPQSCSPLLQTCSPPIQSCSPPPQSCSPPPPSCSPSPLSSPVPQLPSLLLESVSPPQIPSSSPPFTINFEDIDAPLPPLPPLPPQSSSSVKDTFVSSANEETVKDCQTFTFDTSSIPLDSIELPASAPSSSVLLPPPLPSAALLGDFSIITNRCDIPITSHCDIPMPDDPNRYSPSLPIDDDPPPLPCDTNFVLENPPPVELPTAPPLPAGPPPPAFTQSVVLGRQQAKKRLLAFSMTKQGGGAGLSFSLPKKSPVLNKDASKMFSAGDGDLNKKKPKKAKESKARGTIEEIEELKRKENELMEAREILMPKYGQIRVDALSIAGAAAAAPILSTGAISATEQTDETRSVEIESIVDELLAKRQKKKKQEDEERERRLKRKEEREKKKKRMRTLPRNWYEFNKDKHRVYHFRRFKYEVEKQMARDAKEDKRRRRSSRDRRSRSRDRDRKPEKKEQTVVASDGRINLLETPMVVRKVLVAIEAQSHGPFGTDIEFPEYLIRYTKTIPSLTFCENPRIATYHLQTREQMLATVPPNIEDIIFKFLRSIMPKRFRELRPLMLDVIMTLICVRTTGLLVISH